jgi:predicted amidohydrolase
MRIALAQFSINSNAFRENINKIESYAKRASEQKVDLLCLPEMCTTGFCWPELAAATEQTKQGVSEIQAIARSSGLALCGSFLTGLNKSEAQNTLLYIEADGSIVASYAKVHLFKPLSEDNYLKPGDAIVTAQVKGARIGCSICYDLRFPELFRKCAKAGAELQILPAAFPKPRLNHWRALLQARAMENQNFIIATNQCGSGNANDDIQYFGHSMLVHPSGEIIYEAGEEAELGIVDIDLSDLEQVRQRMHCLQDLRPELY